MNSPGKPIQAWGPPAGPGEVAKEVLASSPGCACAGPRHWDCRHELEKPHRPPGCGSIERFEGKVSSGVSDGLIHAARRVHGDPVPSRGLRRVERGVGRAQKLCLGFAVRREHGEPDRNRDLRYAPAR
jgi:hypothetical protein